MLKLLKNRQNKYCLRFLLLKTFLFFSFFAIISCASSKKAHNYINYDNESTVLYQIKQVEELLDKRESVKALLQAELLTINTKDFPQVKELKEKAIKQTNEAFVKSIEKEEWTNALSYFRSLATIGSKPNNWTEDRIFKNQKITWKKQAHEALLNLTDKNYTSSKHPQNFAEMLKGTVTVWVNRGTKIERGMGFSDIVIGSGFFIDSQGYFITNYHVIQSEVDPKYEGYSKLYIKSPSDGNMKIPAKVIGWDPLYDLALVKTEITPEIIFPLGSSQNLEIGSKIFAIGSPAGLEKTLTSGIVSTKYRRLFSLVDVMQIDAAINHGNSGGPIVNEKGLVQAVVFAGLEENEGLNFAIPVEHLKKVLPKLYEGGKVEHTWLGAYGSEKEVKNNEVGIEASYILPNSTLDISGVKEGSIITEFNGVKVATIEELQREILSLSQNTISKMRGYEKSKSGELIKKEWPILCQKRPKLPGEEVLKKDSLFRAMQPIFGLHLESAGKRKTYRVTKVDPGSFGDEAGFTKNDYIEINGKNRYGEEEEIIRVHIYAKKVKAGYIDSFMVISAYLDNGRFF